ncbi:MAG: hypothetical protein Q4C03_05230 [bacterium]|nr:hypothetical protein [bacterium]
MTIDDIVALEKENARLKEEILYVRDRWERELIVAKAQILTLQEELEAMKARLRASLLRTIEADDEVFSVREEAAKAIQAATTEK